MFVVQTAGYYRALANRVVANTYLAPSNAALDQLASRLGISSDALLSNRTLITPV